MSFTPLCLGAKLRATTSAALVAHEAKAGAQEKANTEALASNKVAILAEFEEARARLILHLEEPAEHAEYHVSIKDYQDKTLQRLFHLLRKQRDSGGTVDFIAHLFGPDVTAVHIISDGSAYLHFTWAP